MEPKESVTVTPGNNWIPDQKCANNDNNEIMKSRKVMNLNHSLSVSKHGKYLLIDVAQEVDFVSQRSHLILQIGLHQVG